jgi:hypothetical protein
LHNNYLFRKTDPWDNIHRSKKLGRKSRPWDKLRRLFSMELLLGALHPMVVARTAAYWTSQKSQEQAVQ